MNDAERDGAADAASPEITEWRRRMDAIDDQILRLLNSRSACAVEIGRLKRRRDLPIYSPERESRILERLSRDNRGPLSGAALRRVFERVIDESRRLERQAAETPAPGGRSPNPAPEETKSC